MFELLRFQNITVKIVLELHKNSIPTHKLELFSISEERRIQRLSVMGDVYSYSS
jgi:hypothetical protein